MSENTEINDADLEDNSSLFDDSDWESNFTKKETKNLLNTSFENKGNYVPRNEGIKCDELD